MNASTAVPATVEIRRSRLLTVIAAAAVAAAATTWVLVGVAFDNSASSTSSRRSPAAAPISPAARDARNIPSIMALTPARLAAGALGAGYALPTTQTGPSLTTVLAAMSPSTRRYTKAVTSLTFAQLAAGAAGHP
jgi:hypothetical protein